MRVNVVFWFNEKVYLNHANLANKKIKLHSTKFSTTQSNERRYNREGRKGVSESRGRVRVERSTNIRVALLAFKP